MKTKTTLFGSILFLLLSISPELAIASGSGITYNGRILDPNGNSVVSTNVQFRIQLRTPGNENCRNHSLLRVIAKY
jgi:hypothetical protein